MCCNRQEMQVIWCEGEKRTYMGKIVDPWDCCNYSFKIYDEENKVIFTIVASCCQLYFWCNLPCEKCQRVEFTIKQEETENVLGMLTKIGKGCCKSMLDESYNNFQVDFPKQSNWKERALLMSCAVFIDYMMFEEKRGKKGGAQGGAFDD
eukprot:TRINITY_DN49697_c0_g1_i1.p2 TRINITY_DN49697_c0_g1~~TRINITY_DN49697_c0_g1_i1.p2  ORF type:complete len:150 (+),score=27.32 TRINITY_DN49697_c0_g1_i1:550-999(+)